MEILAAFAIIISLFTAFHPQKEIPKNELVLFVGENELVQFRTETTPLSEIEFKDVVRQSFDYSCGSASLATLLNFHLNEELTERQVIQGLLEYGNSEKIAQRRAFSLLDMKRFVKALGHKGMGFKASMDDLKGLSEPCIVPIEMFGYRHFVVYKGFFQGHFFVADPWRGNISFSEKDFLEKWYQNVIFMVNPGEVEGWSALLLSEEDLRFIDEDIKLYTLFDRAPLPQFQRSRDPIDFLRTPQDYKR